MAVEHENAFSGPFTANGVTTVFPFDFHAASVDEVSAIVDGEPIDAEDYDVTLADDGTGSITISPALAEGEIYIASAPNFRQETSFQRFGPFYPDRVNPPLDRAAIRDIWLKEQLSRTPQIPLGGGSGVAGQFLRVNLDGTWGFSVGSGGEGGAGTNISWSMLATSEAQTSFDFSAMPVDLWAEVLASLVDPKFEVNGTPLDDASYSWSAPLLTILDDYMHVDDVVTLTSGVSYDQGVVDYRNVLGLASPTGADKVGSKYPIALAAARPVGDRLSDRMPTIWDFYRPDLGDTEDDWSPQMNRAAGTDHDIYFPTARRPQGYDLLGPVTQNPGGQMYYGDPTGTGPGAGTEFNIPATFPLGGLGVIIIPSNLTERGCGLSNIGFRFQQPDTYNRANLVQYPYAVYARDVARMQLLGRVTVYLGYKGFDLIGNNGGLKVEELRLGCFDNGLVMDGSYDKSNIGHIELWPYGCGAESESQGLYSIYSDGVCNGIDLGRIDGFSANSIKTFRQRILLHPAVHEEVGTDGFGTIGELHLDGTYGRLEVSAGKMAIASWYATTADGDDYFINQSGGALSVGPCGWGLGAGGTDGQALIQVSGGRFMNNGGGFYEAIPTDAPLLYQTGGDVMWFGGNIASGANQVRTQPFFDVSGGRISLKNPRFIDPGTGSGDCLRITNDNWHDVEINTTLTRGFSIPAPGGSGTYKFGSTVQAPAL